MLLNAVFNLKLQKDPKTCTIRGKPMNTYVHEDHIAMREICGGTKFISKFAIVVPELMVKNIKRSQKNFS